MTRTLDTPQPVMSEANAPIPAVQSGAVAWRVRMRGPFIRPDRTKPGPWTLTTDGHFSERYLEQYEVQPLYAAPQSEPLPGGVGEITPAMCRAVAERFQSVPGEIPFEKLNSGAQCTLLGTAKYALEDAFALSGKEQG